MLVPMIVLEVLVMVGAPIVLALCLRRRHGTRWLLLVAGAMAFVGSQVVHIPLNVGLTVLFGQEWMLKPPEVWAPLFNAVVLGLSAGLCEEVARYIVYRFWAKDARSWCQALMVGTGHGGIESVLVALLVAVTLVNMILMRNLDASSLPVVPEQAGLVAERIAEFWVTPWYMPLLAAAERLMSLLTHLALSTLVVRVFVTGRLWPLFAAIAWHAVFNGAGLYVQEQIGPVAAEGAFAVLSVGSALILWATWRAEQQEVRAGAAN